MLKFTTKEAREERISQKSSTPRSNSTKTGDTPRKKAVSAVKPASKASVAGSRETTAAVDSRSKAGPAPTKDIVDSGSTTDRRARLLSPTATVGDVKKVRPQTSARPNPIHCLCWVHETGTPAADRRGRSQNQAAGRCPPEPPYRC